MVSTKLGFAALVALAAASAIAGPAQAQVINPPNTPVFGMAEFPTLDYEGVMVQCDEGSLHGDTGTDQSFIDFEMSFAGNCNVNGLGATVTCSTLDPSTGDGGLRWSPLDATTNAATMDPNPGFFCEVAVAGVCTIRVDGPQDPDDAASIADLIGEGTGDPKLDVRLSLAATRTGSSFCGPPTGVLTITGLYDLTPTSFSVD
jgi:hypothetical protein